MPKPDAFERGNIEHLFLDFMQMKDFAAKPIIMKSAHGVWYEDVEGKKYLDGLSGVFVANAGHGNKRIIQAIRAQLDEIAFAPPLHSTNMRALELSSLLCKVLPKGLDTIKLFSGGSESTEGAMKLARQFHRQTGNPHKFKVISRYEGYHGATMGALGASGITKRKVTFEPFGPGYIHVFPPTCYRCPYGLEYPDCAVLCATIIEKVVKQEDPSTVSAIIVEPIGNTGGIITPPIEYFKILREIADKYRIVLIFDEIITGFGRTGRMFAAQTFGVTPDIICMGKGMSSGYAPVGGIAFNDEIADAFYGKPEDNVQFNHGHTFGGNPLSSAAAMASVSEIRDRNLPKNAREMGAKIVSRLDELKELGVIGDVRGRGLMIGVEFVKDTKTKKQFEDGVNFGLKVGKRALQKGLILRYDPHWIAFAPPLVINKGETEKMMDIFSESLRETLKQVN
ncbi:MAG TPA: aspartate aminotransferase family protein [Nitrososphaerales archaeon]|nr:aspartate aminotransferase family protein [Nitrososphaerales archaeon]